MRIYLFVFLPLFITGCHPRIYRYDVSRTKAGIDDSINVTWDARGSVFLKIHDTSLPYVVAPPVPTIRLLVRRNGRTESYTLRPADTVVLQLPASGNLSMRKAPEGDSTPRFRFMRLVVEKNNEDSTRDTQIEFVRSQLVDSVNFRPDTSGADLVAAGDGDARWGGFQLLTVTDGMGRELTVTHAGVTVSLHVGETSNVFSGTPVTGSWVLRTPLSAAEAADLKQTPKALTLRFIVKTQ